MLNETFIVASSQTVSCKVIAIESTEIRLFETSVVAIDGTHLKVYKWFFNLDKNSEALHLPRPSVLNAEETLASAFKLDSLLVNNDGDDSKHW
jgi:hypothetical protein